MPRDDTRCTPQPGSAGTLSQPDTTPASPRVSDERLAGLIAMVRAGASTNPLVDNLACDLAACRAELAAVRGRETEAIQHVREYIRLSGAGLHFDANRTFHLLADTLLRDQEAES